MLLSFTVENFLSFKEAVNLDLSASSIKELEAENVAFLQHNQRVLKSIAIYGANSSGKSNLFSALIFFKNFVLNSSKDSQADEPITVDSFRLSSTTDGKPSRFEIIFFNEGIKYRYGFRVDVQKVHEEWLYFTKINKEYNYFKRDLNQIEVDLKFEEGKKIEAFGVTRPNALFLSVVAQLNGKIAQSIVRWFDDLKYVNDTNQKYQQNYSSQLLDNIQLRSVLRRYLEVAQLGFSDIEKHEIRMPGFSMFSKELRDVFHKNFKKETILLTVHKKFDKDNNPLEPVYFNLNKDESLGTQKYFAISRFIIEALYFGRVLIIDEFDSRLHPLLCLALVKLFNSKENNSKNAQLIFITHNSTLLNKNTFRRDQVVFVEKDRTYGNTTLSTLAQNKARIDEAFEKNYLQGDYGGIPNISQDVRLFGEDLF